MSAPRQGLKYTVCETCTDEAKGVVTAHLGACPFAPVASTGGLPKRAHP